jgi:protease-4
MKGLVLTMVVAALLLCGSWGHCYQSPTESSVLPYASVATADDLSAIKFNPAGLGLKRGFQTGFFHVFSDSSFEGDNGWLISAGGLGFSVEWLGNITPQTYRKFSLAQGGELVPGLWWGASYSWFGSRHKDYDDLSSWKLGLLTRPLEFFSLGFVAKDINRPKFTGERAEASFDLGLAVRPLGGYYADRLTLSVDASMSQKERLEDAGTRFRVEAELLDGLVLSGDVDNDGNFGIGGRINLPHLGAGTYNVINQDYEFDQGIIYATFSRDRYRTLLEARDNILEVRLSGKIVEENSRVGLFGKKKPTVLDLITDIKRAKDDRTIRGMLLRIDDFSMGFAKTQEIREAILDFRSGGKWVVAYMEYGGNKEYYLASASDKIVLMPTGYLMLTGIAAQVTFIKGTLEKLGVVADLEHIGDYKNASDYVTRKSMSPAHREAINSMLDDLYDQMTEGISRGRGWTQEKTKSVIDEGPFTSREALRAGLVDTLLFYDQTEKLLAGEQTPPGDLWARRFTDGRQQKISLEDYHKQSNYRYSWSIPPKIAVVFATGTILSGKSGSNFVIGDVMGSETIARAIKTAREDKNVKAIVFRVDSGGGEGIASDVIWREITRTKGIKPIIVSMSDVAGSGGYWISCAADTIVSLPGTYTGSIGVITGKLSLEGLYEKIGFDIETVKRGRHADIYSTTHQFDDEEREVIRRQIQEFYSDFVQKVADDRGMSYDEVHDVAQGRVWTGKQAQKRGLVDLLGGLDLALAIAKETAGLAEDEEVRIVTYPKRRFSFDLGGGIVGAGLSSDLKSFMEELKCEGLFQEDQVLLLMPYTIDVK